MAKLGLVLRRFRATRGPLKARARGAESQQQHQGAGTVGGNISFSFRKTPVRAGCV